MFLSGAKIVREMVLSGSGFSIAVKLDGSKVVTGSSDNIVRVFDISTGDYLHIPTGYTDVVNSIAVISDGSRRLRWEEGKELRHKKEGRC
jgi:WD40 repeat protein